jgi:hypothetical protein
MSSVLPPALLGKTPMQKRMLPLKAIRPHLYGTRRLEAGDEYEAPVEEAIAQVAMRKADFVKGKKPAPPPPPETKPTMTSAPVRDPEPDPEPAETPASIDVLRLQATQLGIDVDGRWGAARLQHEIEQAKDR